MLLTIVYYVVPILVLIGVYNRYRVSNLTLSSAYRIQELEMRLLYLKKNNPNIINNEGYNFLIELMPKVRESLSDVSLLQILYLKRKYKGKDPEIISMEANLKKDEHLSNIYSRLISVVVPFILDKSLILHTTKKTYLFCKWVACLFHKSNDRNNLQKIKSDIKDTLIHMEMPTFRYAS